MRLSSPELLVGLTIAAALAAGLGALFFFRTRPFTCEPQCARCGYVVRAIASRRCPECGSRLYPGGVTYRGEFRPPGLGARVRAWSVLIALAWLPYAAPALAAYLDEDRTAAASATYAGFGRATLLLLAVWVAGACVLYLRHRGHGR